MSEDLIKRLRRKALDIKLLHKGSLQLKHSELLKSLYHTQMPQVYDSHHDAHIDDSDEKWIQFKTRYPIDSHAQDDPELLPIQDDATFSQTQDIVEMMSVEENETSPKTPERDSFIQISNDKESELTSPDETPNQIQDEDDDSVALQDLDHSKPILVHTGSSRRVDDDVFVQSESKSLDAPLLGLENGDLASQSANHALGLEENQDKDCTKEDSNAIEDELESGSPIEDGKEQDDKEGSDNDDLGSDAAEQDQKEMEDQLSDREDAGLNTTKKSGVDTQAIQSVSFEPDDILEPTQNDLLDADGMGDEEDGTDVKRNDEADDTLHKGQGNGCRRCR
ncbi:hypothetical protein BASA61_009180 [Batrachochytrium salamandrivorans]|nr:hypothetical protein BASA61_009180 [Batrachochytrium salamandrivorans]